MLLLVLAIPRPPAAGGQARSQSGAERFDAGLAAYADGRIDEAAMHFDEAAELLLVDNPGFAADALNNVCLMRHGQGRFQVALEACERALELRRREPNPGELAILLNNLGLVLQNLGRLDEAEQRFAAALALNEQRGSVEGRVANWSNLAIVDWQRGNYRRARERLERALELSSDSSEEWAPARTVAARLNLGAVLERTGAYREALDLYRDLLAEPERLAPSDRAAALVNQGVIYRNLGDPRTAIERFRAAAEIDRARDDAAATASSLLNEGIARYANLGDSVGGEEALLAAFQQAEVSGDPRLQAEVSFHLGEVARIDGRFGEAESLYQRCLGLAERGGFSEGSWSARYGLGLVGIETGALELAWRHLEQALAEIEQVRAALDSPMRRASYLVDKREVYGVAVRALIDLAAMSPREGWEERAFAVVQRAKARSVLDALGPESAAGVPLDLVQVTERLSEQEALIELFVARGRLVRFVLLPDQTLLDEVPEAEALLAEVGRIHRMLSSGEAPSEDRIAALASALLPEILRERPPPDLWVAPDGRLRYLPFEILPVGRSGRPLVEQTVVRYLPSASALGASDPPAPPSTLRLLGIGAPDSPEAGGGSAPPLERARRELEDAARAVGGETWVLLGGDATPTALREGLARGAEVLHVAAHTRIDERTRLGTAIELAGGEGGLLSPRDIASLDGARLTVLSGCSTSLGFEEDGAALDSLVGAFLAAGSQGVIATLWEVGDQEASVLMARFYRELARERDPGRALVLAKRALLADDRWAEPSRWSAFVLIGAVGSLEVGRTTAIPPWLLLAFGVGLVAAATAVVVRSRVTTARSQRTGQEVKVA